LLHRGLHELGVERSAIVLAQRAVGRAHVGDAGQCEFAPQPILMRAKHALGTPARFRQVGRDHLDAQLLHRAAKLRGIALVDLATGLGRVPVMAASIRVETRKQPPRLDDFAHPAQRTGRPSSSTKNIE